MGPAETGLFPPRWEGLTALGNFVNLYSLRKNKRKEK